MRTFLAFAALVLFAVPTQAGVYVVEAVGTYSLFTDDSPITAPNTSFEFLATITAPVTSGGAAAFSNASYKLGGNLVVAPVVNQVTFYSVDVSGLFDFLFSDASAISLYGPQIFDVSGELIPGVYQTTLVIGGPMAVNGSATVTVRPLNVVPEPSTLAGAGLAVIGGIVAVRRRRVRMAA